MIIGCPVVTVPVLMTLQEFYDIEAAAQRSCLSGLLPLFPAAVC
jgi:hypothetical protein